MIDLRGVVGGPLSPFRRDLSLDFEALERNTAEMARHPFSALLMAGGIAECYSLTPDEIVESCRLGRAALGEGMPVIGCAAFNTAVATDLARRLERAGAAALLVLPPCYANPPEEGLLAYYRAIGQATGLPLIIYSRDWAVFAPETVARLTECIPTLAAWKDGQGDIRRYQRIMQKVGDRLVWLGGAGDDCLPGYCAIGVAGCTSSLCNIAPTLSLRMFEAGCAGDFRWLNQMMARYVHPLFRIRDRRRGNDVAVMKEAMEMFGITAGPVRPPLAPLREEERRELYALKDILAEAQNGNLR